MNRRNWLTAIVGSVAWLVFRRKAQPKLPITEPLKELGEFTFTQYWEPVDLITAESVLCEFDGKDTIVVLGIADPITGDVMQRRHRAEFPSKGVMRLGERIG
jgi:hypothetical protein